VSPSDGEPPQFSLARHPRQEETRLRNGFFDSLVMQQSTTNRGILDQQMKKMAILFWIGIAMFGLALVGVLLGYDLVALWLALLGLTIYITSLIWMNVSLRCPSCRARLWRLTDARVPGFGFPRAVRCCPYCARALDRELEALQKSA